jgi:hypothetical protein
MSCCVLPQHWVIITSILFMGAGIHKEMYDAMAKEKELGTLKMGLLFFRFSHYFKVYKDYLVNFELALVRRGKHMNTAVLDKIDGDGGLMRAR